MWTRCYHRYVCVSGQHHDLLADLLDIRILLSMMYKGGEQPERLRGLIYCPAASKVSSATIMQCALQTQSGVCSLMSESENVRSVLPWIILNDEAQSVSTRNLHSGGLRELQVLAFSTSGPAKLEVE